MTHVVTQPCFASKYRECVDVCPVDCIYEGEEMLYIHPKECIDCGMCVDACPVQAIYPDMEVPLAWQGFIALNAELAPQSPNAQSLKSRR
jgi:ferredoxin